MLFTVVIYFSLVLNVGLVLPFSHLFTVAKEPISLLQSLLDLEYCLPKLSYHLKVLDITTTVENRISNLSYFNSTFPHKKNIITLVSIKTLPSKTKLFSWRYLVAKNNIDLIRLVLPFLSYLTFLLLLKSQKSIFKAI